MKNNNKAVFRTAYGAHKRVVFKPEGRSRTKQAFAKECNINNIIAKYQRTGAIDHFAKHAGRYDDFPASDFHEMLNQVTEATSMFEELPANIRSRFDNDPGEFLEFVQDPTNGPQMAELGLARATPSPHPVPPLESDTGRQPTPDTPAKPTTTGLENEPPGPGTISPT